MKLNFTRTNGPVDEAIDRLIDLADDISNPLLLTDLDEIRGTIRLGRCNNILLLLGCEYLHDVKHINAKFFTGFGVLCVPLRQEFKFLVRFAVA